MRLAAVHESGAGTKLPTWMSAQLSLSGVKRTRCVRRQDDARCVNRRVNRVGLLAGTTTTLGAWCYSLAVMMTGVDP